METIKRVDWVVVELWIWTDGGSRRNPGPAAIGVVIQDKDGQVIWEEGRYLGAPISNNQAEYQAIKEALRQAKRLSGDVLHCRLDSQLVVEQLCGRYKVKDAGLQVLWQEVQQEIGEFTEVELKYVPRKENARADALVNKALDAHGF